MGSSDNTSDIMFPRKRKLTGVAKTRPKKMVTQPPLGWHTPDSHDSVSNLPPSIDLIVSRSRYCTAFRRILARGKKAERSFRLVMKQIIQKEIKSFIKKPLYPKLENMDDISNFKWVEVIEDLRKVMPTLVESLEGMMPKKPPADLRSVYIM